MKGGDVIFSFKGDDKALKSTTESVAKSLGNGLVGAGKLAVGAIAGVGAAMTGLLGVGVKFNSEIEQYNTSFKTMLGSADEAMALTSKLKDMASKTPFELGDLAKGTQTLLAFGFEADDATKYLKVLGDVSQGNKDRFDSLTLAFAQTSSTGKLMGQDLLQMVNAGFNPLQIMSEKSGKSMATLKEEMSKGAISAEMVQEAFVIATSEGGRFYGAMENQSKTMAGQLSTLKDNAKSLAGALAGGLSNTIVSQVLPNVNSMIQGLQTAFETGGIDAFVSKLGDTVANIISSIATQLPKFIDLGVTILKSLIQGIVNNLPTIIPALIQMAVSLTKGLLDMLPMLLTAGIQLFVGLIQGIATQLPTLLPMIINSLLGLIPLLLNMTPQLIMAGFQLFMGLVNGLINSIPVIIQQLPFIIESLINGLMAELVVLNQ